MLEDPSAENDVSEQDLKFSDANLLKEATEDGFLLEVEDLSNSKLEEKRAGNSKEGTAKKSFSHNKVSPDE